MTSCMHLFKEEEKEKAGIGFRKRGLQEIKGRISGRNILLPKYKNSTHFPNYIVDILTKHFIKYINLMTMEIAQHKTTLNTLN